MEYISTVHSNSWTWQRCGTIIFKIAVAGGCFFTIWRIWPNDRFIFERLWHAPKFLLAAILLRPLFTLLLGVRTSLLAAQLWPGLPRGAVIRMTYLGQIFNQFLPGGVGGDLVRATMIERATRAPWIQIAGLLALDRIIGLAMLLLLAALVAGSAMNTLGLWPSRWVIALVGLALLASAYAGRHLAARDLLQRFAWGRNLHAGLRAVGSRVIWSAMLLALLSHACLLISCGLVFDGAGLPFAWPVRISILAISFVLAALPLTIGGHGIREGALVWLLSAHAWGGAASPLMSVGQAVMMAITLLLVHVVCNIGGGILVWLVWHNPQPRSPA